MVNMPVYEESSSSGMEFCDDDIKVEEISVLDEDYCDSLSDSGSIVSKSSQNMIFTQIYVPHDGRGMMVPSVMEYKNRPGRKQKLEHLTFEEKLIRKKLKNREAAQTSRDRKKARMSDLELQVRYLQEQNERLRLEKEEACKENERLKQEITKPPATTVPASSSLTSATKSTPPSLTTESGECCSSTTQNATRPARLQCSSSDEMTKRVDPSSNSSSVTGQESAEDDQTGDGGCDATGDSLCHQPHRSIAQSGTGGSSHGNNRGQSSPNHTIDPSQSNLPWSEGPDWDWLLDLDAGPSPVSVQQLEQLAASLLESASPNHSEGAESGAPMVGPRTGRVESGPLSSRQRAPLSPAPSAAASTTLSSTPRPVLPHPAQTTLPLRHHRGVHAQSPCPVLLKQATPSPLSPTSGLKPTTTYKKIVPKCSPNQRQQHSPLYDPLTPIISRVSPPPSNHSSCQQQQQRPLNHSLTLFPSGTFVCTNVTAANSITSFSNIHNGQQIQSSLQKIQSYPQKSQNSPQRSTNSSQRSTNSQRIQKYLSCHSRIVPATGAPSKPATSALQQRSVKKVASKTLPLATTKSIPNAAPCLSLLNCCDHDYFKPSTTASSNSCTDGSIDPSDTACINGTSQHLNCNGTNVEGENCSEMWVEDSVDELRIEDAVEEVVTCDIEMEGGLETHGIHRETDASHEYNGICTHNLLNETDISNISIEYNGIESTLNVINSNTLENTPTLSCQMTDETSNGGEKDVKSTTLDHTPEIKNSTLRNVDRKSISINGRIRRNSCQQRRRKQQQIMMADILNDFDNFDCSSTASKEHKNGLFGPLLSSLEEYDAASSCTENLDEILSGLESAGSLQSFQQDLQDELGDSFSFGFEETSNVADSGSVGGFSTSGNVVSGGSELSCKLADITRGLDLDVEDYEDVGPVVNPCKMFDLELVTTPRGGDLETNVTDLTTPSTSSSSSDRGYESVDSPLSSVESDLGGMSDDFLGVNEKEMSVNEMMGLSEDASSFLMFPDLGLEI